MRRMMRIPKKRCATILFLLVLFTFYLHFRISQYSSSQVIYHSNPESPIRCFRNSSAQRLPDITSEPIRKDKSIFFHETSCKSHDNGKIMILPQQACAVESAARINPELDVYLTFSSPGIFKFEGTESDRLLQKLLEYKNLKILHLNYANYTRGTPLEELYSSGKIDDSCYSQNHASDVLRYLTLYKYGGVYLDLDMIVLRPLSELGINYAGIDGEGNVSASVLSFQHEGSGRAYALFCIMHLKNNFKPHALDDNGSGVITRLLRKLCGVSLARDMPWSDCKWFVVRDSFDFYPVSFGDREMYFDPDKADEVLLRAYESYALHIWNKSSNRTKAAIGTKTAYTMFAEDYCPKVYQECHSCF